MCHNPYVYINDLNLKGFEFKLKLAASEYSILIVCEPINVKDQLRIYILRN